MLLSLGGRAEDLRKTIQFGGMERSYYVHLPAVARDKPLPLLILLHGGGGGAKQALENYPLTPLADREGFILVAPNGTGPLPRELLRTWNVGWGFGYAQVYPMVPSSATTRARPTPIYWRESLRWWAARAAAKRPKLAIPRSPNTRST